MPELSAPIHIAGVDEAGRGPLAGPVIAAAVILPARHRIKGLADSKQLTPQQRDSLFEQIINKCIAYGVGCGEVAEIDQINIHHATLLAMRRAVEALAVSPDAVWVDGLHAPVVTMAVRAIPHGDETVPVISAASIIAKVTRDRIMQDYETIYPGYGFAQHKGYGTPQHFRALQELGATPIHRRSFAPVAAVVMPN
jgi:ribonuclease HII